jgi:cell division protein FtsB
LDNALLDWRRIRRAVVTVAISTSRPADARRSRGDVSDPAPVESALRARQRPALFVLLTLVFMTGSAAALFANGGHLERKRLEARRDASNVELDRQLHQVHSLRQEVDSLAGDSLARERLAREELGYTRSGEMIFLLAEPPEDSKNRDP